MEKKPKANKKSSDKPCSSKDARIKLLVAEKVLLKRWINDLQSGMYINCVYCGHRYGPREGTPVSMADVLKEHIETCPEHPMSKLKERVTELEAENTALRCKPVITEYSELDVRWQELVAEWNKARIKLYNLRTEIESSLPLILTQEQIERFELISQAPCEASALDIQYMAALLLRQIKGKSE